MGGVRRKGGAISIQALLWNYGNSMCDVKGADQVKKSEVQSTDAQIEDGPVRSSVEAPVIGVERRGRIVPVEVRVNF